MSMKVDKKHGKSALWPAGQCTPKHCEKSVLYFVNSVVKMSENEVILVTRWHCKLYVECIVITVIIIMTSFQSCAVVTPTLFFFFFSSLPPVFELLSVWISFQ